MLVCSSFIFALYILHSYLLCIFSIHICFVYFPFIFALYIFHSYLLCIFSIHICFVYFPFIFALYIFHSYLLCIYVDLLCLTTFKATSTHGLVACTERPLYLGELFRVLPECPEMRAVQYCLAMVTIHARSLTNIYCL